MKRVFISLLAMLAGAMSAMADYTDVPYSLDGNGQFTGEDNYTFSTKTGYYQEWDHYVIFWSTGYGKQSGTPTSIGSGDYYLDLSQMKTYAEKCYTTYKALGFADPTSSEYKGHKIIILAYYSTGWYATGSGYGDYGTLNISHASANPSATNPFYTYCHEIAHAYQYLGNMKNGGNAGFQYGDYYGYVSYYECCGNWQAAQIYQNAYFPQISPVYLKTTNLAFGHQWHCYQAYPMNDYFTEKRKVTAIGDIWTINTNTKYADAVEKYMSTYNLSAEDIYREFFWGAMRMVTWDLSRWDAYLSAEGVSREAHMDHTPGTKAAYSSTTTPNTYNDNCWRHQSTYQYVTTDQSKAIHQVAYSSCPQSTGYNIIKLNVPSGSNRTVTTTFTALPSGSSLASGDNKEYWTGSMWATNSSISNYNTSATSECNSNYNTYKSWRGFRLGYVTYNKSTGERKYNYTDKVFCTGTDKSSVNIQFDVPEDADSLFLVVSPALSNYLRMGSQDPYNISSDDGYLSAQKERDQWPYTVQFYNTNIYGLSNPSTTFSGTAETGTTYTSAGLPDMGTGEGESGSSTTGKNTEITLKKDITIDNSDGTTTSAQTTLSTAEMASIATAFGVDATTLTMAAANLIDYTDNQAANTIMFMPATADCKAATGTSNCTSGNYTFGHWFTTAGAYTNAGSSDAKLYSQLSPYALTFNVGENGAKNGNYTICQALRYYDGTNTGTAYIQFNVTVKGTIHHAYNTVDITKTVKFDTSATEYVGGQVTLTSAELDSIAACFGITVDNLKDTANYWEAYNANGQNDCMITLCAVKADGTTLAESGSTANGYGHWFNANNEVCSYGSSNTVFSELDVPSVTFTLGQEPGTITAGTKQNITQAIVFTEGGNKYIAYIHFNMQIGEEAPATGISNAASENATIVAVYGIDGIQHQSLRPGFNIVKLSNGDVKKLYINK